MFPTIVGAWVLDGGEAGRSRFCYPKGQSRAAATGGGCWGGLVSWLSSVRMGLGRAREELEMEMADGRSESKSKSRRPSPGAVKSPAVLSQQSLNTVVLVAGSCWLLTSHVGGRAGLGRLLLLLMSAGETEG